MGALVLGSLGVAAPIWAQQASQTSGIQLRFGLALRAETQSNRTLDPIDPGSSSDLSANLSLNVLSETPIDRLSFDLGGTLRALDGPGVTSSQESGFVRPSAALSYDRTSASARLSLNAEISRRDLADSDNLILDPITGLFTIVNGNATQRREAVSAQLDLGTDAPFGYGALVRLERSTYSGGGVTGVGGSENQRQSAPDRQNHRALRSERCHAAQHVPYLPGFRGRQHSGPGRDRLIGQHDHSGPTSWWHELQFRGD